MGGKCARLQENIMGIVRDNKECEMDGFLLEENNRESLDFYCLETTFLLENCSYQTAEFQQPSWKNVPIFGADRITSQRTVDTSTSVCL